MKGNLFQWVRRWPLATQTNLAMACLAILVIAVYANSLRVPFFFDDFPGIRDNASIRRLWAITEVLTPPSNAPVNSRPVVNLSFAINYAIGGLDPVGYHVFNVIAHLGACLLLFGVVRRTLVVSPVFASLSVSSVRDGEARKRVALRLAVSVAALWAVHPLQTESVTFTVQRAEVFMGASFFCVFYCFLRSLESTKPVRWQGVAVLVCALGMGSKEVMVVAPLLLVFFDRAFFADGWRRAWELRKRLYIALAATWLLLIAFIVRGGGSRNGAVDFTGDLWWRYMLTQCEAIVRYVGLALWPHPLVMDYGKYLVDGMGDVAWQMPLVLAALGGTAVAVWRKPAFGFCAAWFFVLLAPSSSVVPLVTQTMAEHRMYLPLLTVVVAAVALVYNVAGRYLLPLVVCVTGILAAVAVVRNHDYRSELSIWEDTARKWPGSPRAHATYGAALLKIGMVEEGIQENRHALRSDSAHYYAYNNLGNAYRLKGDLDTAIKHYATALAYKPESPEFLNNLGLVYLENGDDTRAELFLTKAVAVQPAAVLAHQSLARLYYRQKDYNKSLAHCRLILEQEPTNGQARHDAALALMGLGREEEAVEQFRVAVADERAPIEARWNYGCLLLQLGRAEESIVQFTAVRKERPESARAHRAIGDALVVMSKLNEAVLAYQQSLAIDANDAIVHDNLGCALARLGRNGEAMDEFRKALALSPAMAEAHYHLGTALLEVQRPREAEMHFRAASDGMADYAEIHVALARALARQGAMQEAARELDVAMRLKPGSEELGRMQADLRGGKTHF